MVGTADRPLARASGRARVLVTDSDLYAPAAVAMVRGLALAGYEPWVLAAGPSPAMRSRAAAGGALMFVADRKTTQELFATEPLLLELLAGG